MSASLTLLITGLWLFSVGVYQGHKSLPPGLNYASEIVSVDENDVSFLWDLTSENAAGDTLYQQQIFDSLFHYIGSAEQYILIDMFLFNQYTGPSGDMYRNITLELQDTLLAQKQKHPQIKIDFISDPVNTFYGGSILPEFKLMADRGINVIITDMTPTRDSAPIYSSIWRTFFQWFGNSTKGGLLPNPFNPEGPKVTLRSYLDFLNLKANHRKIFIADTPGGPISLVMSANPHSASSSFSNVALMSKGSLAHEIYATEEHVAKMSGAALQGRSYLDSQPMDAVQSDHTLQVLTELQIKEHLMANIDALDSGDSLHIGMFYFSNREVIKGLIAASKRGARIQIVLDPNKDGFGYYRSGIPNQVIAGELLNKSTEDLSIRWYLTHGEEYHSKLALFLPRAKPATLIIGSANYTRKNIDNYNLELDVLVQAPQDSPLMQETRSYFEKLWLNQDQIYTVEYKQFENTSFLRTLQYRFQEFTGLGVY